MAKLLRLLFKGCWSCCWETISERRLTDEFGATGTRYVMRCNTCGKISWTDVI